MKFFEKHLLTLQPMGGRFCSLYGYLHILKAMSEISGGCPKMMKVWLTWFWLGTGRGLLNYKLNIVVCTFMQL